jgi:hypothetical protein
MRIADRKRSLNSVRSLPRPVTYESGHEAEYTELFGSVSGCLSDTAENSCPTLVVYPLIKRPGMNYKSRELFTEFKVEAQGVLIGLLRHDTPETAVYAG